MVRSPLIAGNWKMNKTEAEAISLARKVQQRARDISGVEVLICPPFTSLSQLHKLLISSHILLGAQNISHQAQGAYTGEISASMVREFCSHVILGHSERRAYYDEDDDLINSKVRVAHQIGLIPVLCLGESLAERDAGSTAQVLSRQLRTALDGIIFTDPSQLVIAYEPIWAIGTGRSADPDDISRLIGDVIRPTLVALGDEKLGQGVQVIYGGSVNPGNARGYLKAEEIDGALVGGASLDAELFLSIIEQSL